MIFPAYAKIGHLKIPLRWAERKEAEKMDAPAWFDDDQLEICVREGLAVPVQAEALVHELLHAILFASDNHGLTDEQEERAVRSISPFLIMALRDNPQLFDEIRKAVA
jgi:hypothetical protein